MMDVYLSYTDHDLDRARLIHDELVRHDFSVNWDRTIGPGEFWMTTVEKRIEQAKSVVVLFSALSIKSDHFWHEYRFASRLKKVVPVAIDEEALEFPIRMMGPDLISVANWVRDAEAGSSQLDSLLARIERRVWPRSPSRWAHSAENEAKGSSRKHVFVSFASRDGDVALDVVRRLEENGVNCWISSRNVPYGSDFQDAIVEALESAKAMILVFSEAANNSAEIKKEVALASEHELFILPVRIEDVKPTGGFRYQLATRQYIDAFTDREAAILLMVEALRPHMLARIL